MKKLLPIAMGLLATLIAGPGHAVRVNFPDLPLQTGAAYPPPNVMFILDDSGSMGFVAMPSDRSSLNTNITDMSYVNNTIYYNPNTDYKPWIKADNTRYTGGDSYSAAFSDDSLVEASCDRYWSGGSWTYPCTDLSGSTQTFFVPHNPSSYDPANAGDFDRYDIKNVSGTMRIYKTGIVSNGSLGPRTIARGDWSYQSIVVPSGVGSFTVSISGGTGGDADLYVRLNSQPTTSTTTKSTSNGNSESVTITNPSAGTWWIGIYNAAGNGGKGDKTVYNESGSYAMASTTEATPTGRTVAAELKNFATWYSYYRTRMKVAKASASEAFAQMPSSIRVGFDTINRNGGGLPYKINISNGGLFTDASGNTNRSDWFGKMQSAYAQNGTPLHRALRRAGDYFSDTTSSTSPWRPTTASAPISCRQNFAILTTDGYWNSTSSDDAVGNQDGTNGTPILMKDGDYYTYDASAAKNRKYADSRSGTLADVAMKYWKNDLAPTLADNVPTSDADDAFWQHMVTFGLSIGLRGNPGLNLVSIANGSQSWPNPLDNEDLDRIDDLWHASVNGHGSFVAATNPTVFVQGLIDALATVAARTGSASNVTANSTSFQSDTRVYQASYVSGKWIGELSAFDASAAGVATTAAWKASASIPGVDARTVLTWNGSLGKGAAFPIDAGALARTTGLAPVTGSDNAAYIKGNQTKEKQNGGSLRDRVNTVLGDIVDSSPMYVKEINSIFVGANDGMLHAVDASDGGEQFGYIPNGTDKADLASLSDPQYVHRWFMDGPIVVSTRSQTPGHNYLVGAMGRGGSGLFGLDVTNPDSFNGDAVLWDNTWDEDVASAPADYANMGHVLGEPVVVKLNNGDTGVLVGNGLGSSTGTASLFVIDIATGDVITEIDTGRTGGNGMSAPRGWDANGDGTVDYVYAGDLKGNLWKFDLTSTSPVTWKIANAGEPMFVATDSAGARQPITAGLALAQDPGTGNRWVFFGTGQFMFTTDSTDMNMQTMYGIVDNGVVKGRTSTTDDGDLKRRTITLTGSNGKERAFEAHGSLGSYKGWYVDLVQPPDSSRLGERVVNRPLVRGSVLIFSSLIPPTGNTCDAGGKGYINALDAFSGTSLENPYFDANKNGTFDDDKLGSGGSLVPIGSIDLGIGMPTLPTIIDHLLVVGGSSGSMGQSSVNPQGGGARRISWREILRD